MNYRRIADAIAFIAEHVSQQPSLDAIAGHVHLSPFHFQRLFTCWAGITPKRFLQVLTLEHAKGLMGKHHALLDVSNELGLGSASRLYDHFVQLEAVTPGEHKSGGAGLLVEYGIHRTPFGNAFIAITARGVCKLTFMDGEPVGAHLADLRTRWPNARYRRNHVATGPVVEALFSGTVRPNRPLSLHVSGTNFQISVWKALLQIPSGTVLSYSQVAEAVGRPGSARAVGGAIAANPVAFIIPCHRVITRTGGLGGYRWNTDRKRAMLLWEFARRAPEAAEQDSACPMPTGAGPNGQ